MKRIFLQFGKNVTLACIAFATFSLTGQCEEASNIKLQDLRTFEVEQFHGNFNLESHHLDGEYYTHLQNALQANKVLKAGSPADGVIHMTCEGPDCMLIKTSVTVGHDGPEVWHKTVGSYDLYGSYWLGNYQKNPRRISKTVIRKLAQAYQAEGKK